MAVTDVHAHLSLYGRTRQFTAAAVTEALGVAPTRSWEFGDPHPSRSLAAKGKVTIESLWRFSEPPTHATAEDPHGISSLILLAERFEPHAHELAVLKKHYDIVVGMWCSSNRAQGGLLIGPETMRRLGLLSASFMQTVWMSDAYSAEDIADWPDLPFAP